MRLNLVIVTLLCIVSWMSSVHATHGLVSNCCLRWSTTRVHLKKIVNYTHQPEGVCQIKAIVFQTVKGNRICSDPNNDWTKKAIREVDKKTQALQTKRISKQASESTIAPSVSSTSERFHTSSYSGPDSSATTKVMPTVDKETQALEMKVNKEEASESTITPSVSSTSERFQTKTYSDPDSSSTTKAMLTVDKETQALQTKGNIKEGSESTITPSISSTSKSKPKRRSRKLKRRQRKKYNQRKKWMKNLNKITIIFKE